MHNVCCCCAGKTIGIEAKSQKRVSRSGAGLVADSPGRRHCYNLKFIKAALSQT
jgi:hypothetical protein